MTRNVRNFWLDGSIDGRSSSISGGPQAKDGGFSLRIRQREDGSVSDGVTITGSALSDGTLQLTVWDGATHSVLAVVETRRDAPGREVRVLGSVTE